MKSLGLGINEDKDALHLRLLMCQEISSKSEEYQQWLGLTAEQLSIDLNSFRQQGWFNSDAGDIAVKVCSNILQILTHRCHNLVSTSPISILHTT